jgi:hypothetical protein
VNGTRWAELLLMSNLITPIPEERTRLIQSMDELGNCLPI